MLTQAQFEKYVTELNKGHRRLRFPEFKVGDRVKLTDFSGETITGKIESMDDMSVTVNNEVSTAVGNYSKTSAWSEVIDLNKV